jgi:hypothetical protein
MRRDIEGFASEVPHRLFDRAERRGRDQPLMRQRFGTLTIGLDLERRTSVDQREEPLELTAHAGRIACRRVRKAECIGRFAKADEPRVSHQPNEQPHGS